MNTKLKEAKAWVQHAYDILDTAGNDIRSEQYEFALENISRAKNAIRMGTGLRQDGHNQKAVRGINAPKPIGRGGIR